MPPMDHTGPEGKGSRTGRGLGRCRKPTDKSSEDSQFKLGKGIGTRRKSGGGQGKGRRLQEGKQ